MSIKFGEASFELGETATTTASGGTSGPTRKITASRIFDQTTSALKLVRSISSTHVDIASTSSKAAAEVLGLALNAVSEDDTGEILVFGTVTDDAFADFAVGDSLFLGANGDVVNSAPMSSGHLFLAPVGRAEGNSKIFISTGILIALR